MLGLTRRSSTALGKGSVGFPAAVGGVVLLFVGNGGDGDELWDGHVDLNCFDFKCFACVESGQR